MLSANGQPRVGVIGAGVVGTAVARVLAVSGCQVTLADAAGDVGTGTSKANTALLHTGFDATPGSLEATLVARGYRLLRSYASAARIPVELTGALVVAWSPEQADALDGVEQNAVANEYTRGERIGSDVLYHLEPHLGPGAMAAFRVPDESIICPFTPTIRYASEAVEYGADLRLGFQVADLAFVSTSWRVTAVDGRTFECDWLINCAGLRSDEINDLAGGSAFSVVPRKGELLVYDKSARGLLEHILLQVPTQRTKGVVVAPTVFGNVLVGPTAEDIDDKSDTSTTRDGIDAITVGGHRILPDLAEHAVTTRYAGLRAATSQKDYILSCDSNRGYICAGGIRSTGLSASLGIAEHIATWIRGDVPPVVIEPAPGPYIGEAGTRPYMNDSLIALDSAFGQIVCFCERTTLGEIRDTATSTIPPQDLDGLRRRTRAGLGRCQGFYCGAHLQHLLDDPPWSGP